MQARFLLGPAGSGKTFRCLTDVRAALKKNPDGAPLVFLAPKQATFQLERQLLDSEQQDDRPREPKSNSADGSPGDVYKRQIRVNRDDLMVAAIHTSGKVARVNH